MSDLQIATEVDSLVAQLTQFRIEENDSEIKLPNTRSVLKPLVAEIEKLRKAHVHLTRQNEVQTIGEGEFELKRRGEVRDIASRFDETVGSVIRRLTERGNESTTATVAAVSSFETVVNAAEDIRSAIMEVTTRAEQSQRTVAQASDRADEALQISDEVSVAAKEIVDLVNVIEGIAFHTNLLALNASIEAARAGSSGRGFGVVAAEVKRLSRSTSEAAQWVKDKALAMSTAANSMTNAVEMSKTSNGEVSTATKQMITAINTQVKSTERINECAKATRGEMEQVETAIRVIQDEAHRLTDETTNFVQFISSEPGVTDNTVVFGQSAPFSGPASSLGNNIRKGIELAFRMASENGGIHGRQPVLEAIDDAYDPDKALKNVRDLIRSGTVFSLLGAVGTPTSKLSERIARGGSVPFLGPVTGAGILRIAERKHVVNVRASYAQEANVLAGYFAKQGSLGSCGFFFQADAYGVAVRNALHPALAKYNAKIEIEAPYDRLTGDVSEAIRTIVEHRPQTIFMAGTPATTANFVKGIRAAGLDSKLATISFVNSNEFARCAGSAGQGVIISQVVPIPSDNSSLLVRNYRQALRILDANAKPDFAMLEGYVIGMLACEMLERAGPHPTRQNFLATIFAQQTSLELGDLQLTFGPGQNAGTDAVYLSRLEKNQEFSSLGRFRSSKRSRPLLSKAS